MEIRGTTKVLGIFGNPIRHTMSPFIHNTLSKELGIDAVYVPFGVESDICKAVAGAYAMGVSGLNVTVPYKQDVIPCLAEIDQAAAEIGAVNTLVWTEAGYKGYNTDMLGLTKAVQKEGIPIQDEEIVIIGAGGASRAVCYMCLREKAKRIYVLNRTLTKAAELAEDMNRLFNTEIVVPVSAENASAIPKGAYVMFQCTSLGLKENDGLLIQDDEFYDMAKAGYDLIYNPAQTPFMEELMKRGVPVSNGLSMLLYQGIIAYELWNGISVPDILCERVLCYMQQKLYGANIVLVGYMGSGKTTVGNLLCSKYQMKFVDTDQYIEEQQNMSISEIFRLFGEDAFRKLETEALEELSRTCFHTVISTGGGIVLKEENRKLLKKLGTVVFLEVSPDEVSRRLRGDTSRPLLAGDSEEEILQKIETMLAARLPYYQSAADHTVKADEKTPEEIAEEIHGI